MRTMANHWCWEWETFLEPLQARSCSSPPSVRTVNCELSSEVSGSLAERFRESLTMQDWYKALDKNEEVTDAKEDLESLLRRRADFTDLEKRWKKYERALKIKSDRECSGSTWTIAMLERYIKRQDIDFIRPKFRHLTDEAFLKIHVKVLLSIEAIGGGKGNVENLSELDDHTESDIRKILDAILDPLCVNNNLTVRTEQTLKCDFLPNNRYDYIIYYNNQPIGVVEAKRQGCLKDQSVAQLLVQLLLLSAEGPDLFYFGVLSDAYQFIFAGVTKTEVVFFQKNEDKLEIATINSLRDLESIVGKISWLIDKAIKSRIEGIPFPFTQSSFTFQF